MKKSVKWQKADKIILFCVLVVLAVGIIYSIILTEKVNVLNDRLDLTNRNIDSLNNETKKQIGDLSINLTIEKAKNDILVNEVAKLISGSSNFPLIVNNSKNSIFAIVTDVALGTGFMVNSAGYVVTNYHVIEGARTIDVVDIDKVYSRASIVGVDQFKDVALLKINKAYSSLEFADSDKLEVGEKVIAIGNPLALELSFSVTEGIVSGLHRQGMNNLQSYIQTDVPINPGNSGGPLLNKEGKVVGINNFKIFGAEGLSFALEGNVVKQTVNKIMNLTLIN